MGNGSTNKIVVPIPVHVNRFAVRSQHQHMEKMGLTGPKPDLRKDVQLELSGFERFGGMAGQQIGGIGACSGGHDPKTF